MRVADQCHLISCRIASEASVFTYSVNMPFLTIVASFRQRGELTTYGRKVLTYSHRKKPTVAELLQTCFQIMLLQTERYHNPYLPLMCAN
jgi:hypothetical protein